MLEVRLPGAESRDGLGQVEPLDRITERLLRTDPLDRVTRELGGHARHAQLFRSRTGNEAVIDREGSQDPVSGIANRLTPAGAQAVAQYEVARRGEFGVGCNVRDDDGLVLKSCCAARPDV